jgi:hypothetical protein
MITDETAVPETESPEPPAGRPARQPSQFGELATRIGGTLVGMVGALFTALIEIFLTPLRVGTALVPVSLLLVVICNYLIAWFTFRTTTHIGLATLPGVVWLVVTFLAARKTTEGDLLLTGDNWVATVLLIGGLIVYAAALYRLILRS